MEQISVAITHYNRFPLLKECLQSIPDDPRIGEVVIMDDASTDNSYGKILEFFGNIPKVVVRRNQKNLDCYRNKAEAVNACSKEWVLLLDSDNRLLEGTMDAIWNEYPWVDENAYLPVFAEPHFDYRMFTGQIVSRHTVSKFVQQDASRKGRFLTALNTANHFFYRKHYLEAHDPSVNPHTVDSLFTNLNWLKYDKCLYFTPGFHYFHRVHEGSHYRQNVHKTGSLAENIRKQLLEMM